MNKPVHVALVYKNFAARAGISHIGLGVSALNNAKVLKKHGIACSIIPIVNVRQLEENLTKDESITHVVISAPWIPTVELQRLTFLFPRVEFAVNCHSNVGFLQADTNGVRLLREYIELDKGTTNFVLAGNSAKFVRWVRQAYSTTCAYLPNMYYLDYSLRGNSPIYSGGVLRIGAFGATRPQKNLMSAAGAALEICSDLKVDTEFWISGGRAEGGGNTILNSVREMLKNVPGITLRELSWASWPQFRNIVRRMHLLLQVSYTESFNMVTADGVAEGVPSVVSDAIEWAPDGWKAHMDDVNDIAAVGRHLIFDPLASHDGAVCLEQHNSDSFRAWIHWLELDRGFDYHPQINDPWIL